MAEDGIFAAVREVGGGTLGPRLARWLEKSVEGTEDLPLARLLKGFGVDYHAEPAGRTSELGVKLATGTGDEVKLATVYDGGPAQVAGLSAGDVLLALDGLKLNAKSMDAMLARRQVGDEVEIHAFRRDELRSFRLTLVAPEANKISLKLAARAGAAVLKLRRGWLGSTK